MSKYLILEGIESKNRFWTMRYEHETDETIVKGNDGSTWYRIIDRADTVDDIKEKLAALNQKAEGIK